MISFWGIYPVDILIQEQTVGTSGPVAETLHTQCKEPDPKCCNWRSCAPQVRPSAAKINKYQKDKQLHPVLFVRAKTENNQLPRGDTHAKGNLLLHIIKYTCTGMEGWSWAFGYISCLLCTLIKIILPL